MRVLAITPWFPTEDAPGSGIFNLRDVELLSRDHEVTVLHLHDPSLPGKTGEWQTDTGILVKRIHFGLSRPASYPKAIATIRKQAAKADIVHSMAFPALLPVSLSRSLGSRLPWVHTEHWSGLLVKPPTFRASVGRRVLSSKLRAPNAVVAVGQQLAQVIDRHRTDSAVVIGNAVHFAQGKRVPVVPEERGDQPLRIIGVGRLTGLKGPIEALEAVATLQAQGVETVLEWAGTGLLREQMQKRAFELGIASRLSLLGQLSQEELSEALLRAHLFMLPTAGETYGVAIAEALAHGLPVIASGEGGHQDFMPPRASRLVSERTGKALAVAVRDLLADPERWTPRQIVSYARGIFSEDIRRREYQRVYASALEKHAKEHE